MAIVLLPVPSRNCLQHNRFRVIARLPAFQPLRSIPLSALTILPRAIWVNEELDADTFPFFQWTKQPLSCEND
ncbi:hypothetical protein Plim_0742 [Planctopirus limnophila DSM 3776]|uniref:Uncharacterized protein n=2 Tax=Planctopirus TaxID=1649480 RepID=D5SRQ4_PLAL2|nr:hypothetical protein Plim_0742 [Planctopirus limnophila DSM 3776]